RPREPPPERGVAWRRLTHGEPRSETAPERTGLAGEPGVHPRYTGRPGGDGRRRRETICGTSGHRTTRSSRLTNYKQVTYESIPERGTAPPARIAVRPRGDTHGGKRQGETMGLLLAVLLLIIIFAVLGVWVVKFLLWIAVIAFVLWLIGFFVRGAEGARWYRW